MILVLNFLCPKCGKEIPTDEREFHMQILHHPNRAALDRLIRLGQNRKMKMKMSMKTFFKNKHYICKICEDKGISRSFFSTEGLKRHARYRHSLLCVCCDRVILGKARMERHQQSKHVIHSHPQNTAAKSPLVIQPMTSSSQ